MNAVGIDVSKGKSMVAVMRPFGEVVAKPFEVLHTADELRKLADFLKSLDGESRVVMEYTGRYYQPIARVLHDAGIFVSVVHPMLIYNFGNDSIRKVKTDKADAMKIASYGLSKWSSLLRYLPEDETRLLLKTHNRQYNQYMKLKISLKNNLIALLDQTFPGVSKLFTSPVRQDGHEKWVDFALRFWHCQRITAVSKTKFTTQYNNWCKASGYQRSDSKAEQIYEAASLHVPILPPTQDTKLLVVQAISQLNSISFTLAAVRREMNRLASLLPEYPVVMQMHGVGDVVGPQLIAEIGDIRRFRRKQSLTAFAGVDVPPFESGSFVATGRSISKRGSPLLRKTLFQIMSCVLQTASVDDTVFQFLDKKRSEGKHYYVYMVAGCNKFLRIYYGRVKAHLAELEAS